MRKGYAIGGGKGLGAMAWASEDSGWRQKVTRRSYCMAGGKDAGGKEAAFCLRVRYIQ